METASGVRVLDPDGRGGLPGPKGDSRKRFCLASLLRLDHVSCSPSKSASAGRKRGPGDPGFPGGVSPLLPDIMIAASRCL